MNGWEPACYTITRRSGLPRNAHLHAHIYREVAQFLKTTDFVDFDLHRSDGPYRTQAPWVRAVRHSFSAGAALDERGSSPQPIKTVPNPVCASSLDQATRPGGAPHGHPPSYDYPHCTPQAAHGHCRARNDMAATQRCYRRQRQSSTEVTARAHIARARLGLVLRRCPEIPPEHMQVGSRCPRDLLLSQSARGGIARCYC